jgi:cell division protein FtsW
LALSSPLSEDDHQKMTTARHIDKTFLFTTVVIVIAGFFIFLSASLGLLARHGQSFTSAAFTQIFLGLFLGSIALAVLSCIPYRHYRPYALHLLVFVTIVALSVFIPHLGFSYNGARRWIHLGVSFQPSEFFKIGVIVYFAAYLANHRERLSQLKYGFLPLLGMLALIAVVLLTEPDTGTFLVLVGAVVAMYLAAGAPWRDLLLLILLAAVAFGGLALWRPYVMDRFTTFLDPASDPLGSGYQIQQSLIAVGSGQLIGRGFGQSIQKFNFLPEPTGDSIFSVFAEEFGFVGGDLLIVMYAFMSLRGLRIASRSPDLFGGLLVVGIVILIISQSFINIGAMLGVLPLTGVPLVFISHGGTALFFALAEIGIVLNVSRFVRRV